MSWRVPITTAMPAVKPVVTGWGMNSMSRPAGSAHGQEDEAGHHRGQEQPGHPETGGNRRQHHHERRGGPCHLGHRPAEKGDDRPGDDGRVQAVLRRHPGGDGQRHREGKSHHAHHQARERVADQVAPAVARGEGSPERNGRTESEPIQPLERRAVPRHQRPPLLTSGHSTLLARRWGWTLPDPFARRPGEAETETGVLACSDGRPERVRARRVVVPGATASSRPRAPGALETARTPGLSRTTRRRPPAPASLRPRGWRSRRPGRWRRPRDPPAPSPPAG